MDRNMARVRVWGLVPKTPPILKSKMNNEKLREADGRAVYKDYQDRLFFIKELCAMMAQCEPDNADKLVVERDAMILKKATAPDTVDDKALAEAIEYISKMAAFFDDMDAKRNTPGQDMTSKHINTALSALRAAHQEVAELRKDKERRKNPIAVEAGRRLVALARAAWQLADGTEGTVETDDRGESYVRVPEDLNYALCARLDDLETLPELPAPYIGEGPAKAEHALGLSRDGGVQL